MCKKLTVLLAWQWTPATTAIWEGAGGSGPQLHSEFHRTVHFRRSCLINTLLSPTVPISPKEWLAKLLVAPLSILDMSLSLRRSSMHPP